MHNFDARMRLETVRWFNRAIARLSCEDRRRVKAQGNPAKDVPVLGATQVRDDVWLSCSDESSNSVGTYSLFSRHHFIEVENGSSYQRISGGLRCGQIAKRRFAGDIHAR